MVNQQLMKRITLFFTCLILLTSQASFAVEVVTATIDKNPVVQGESFVLRVTADDDADSNALDTSPLLQNFIVGRTSVSSQTSMVNFKTTRQTTWTTVLVAKQPGSYVIPSLTIEDKKTLPITMTVLKADQTDPNQQRDIFITSDISSTSVYVQQQVMLTVKLHFAVSLERGSLSEPSLEGATITQLGQDKETETIINGRRYRIIERNYAINPQRSGEYKITSPVFSGEVSTPSRRRSGLFSFNDTKPVTVLNEDISLTVKPVPAGYQGAWLPSELLNLHQEWQPLPNEFKVGEPITRTITLTAAGLSKEQLPVIEMALPKGLKVYPDQTEQHSGMNSGRLVSQSIQNFAIVASQPGEYQLPKIEIPWWNTVTNRAEIAVIPSQTISVQANPDAQFVQPQTQNSAPVAINGPALAPVIIEKQSMLQWVFLALWLLTSAAWALTVWLKRPKKQVAAPQTNFEYYLALLAACKKQDGKAVEKLLLPWLNQTLGRNYNQLSQAINEVDNTKLAVAVQNMQACYYGIETQDWQSAELTNIIQSIHKQKHINSSKNNIQLNP